MSQSPPETAQSQISVLQQQIMLILQQQSQMLAAMQAFQTRIFEFLLSGAFGQIHPETQKTIEPIPAEKVAPPKTEKSQAEATAKPDSEMAPDSVSENSGFHPGITQHFDSVFGNVAWKTEAPKIMELPADHYKNNFSAEKFQQDFLLFASYWSAQTKNLGFHLHQSKDFLRKLLFLVPAFKAVYSEAFFKDTMPDAQAMFQSVQFLKKVDKVHAVREEVHRRDFH